MKKYDVHVHVAFKEGHVIGGEELISANEMISSMDKRGIDVSVLMTSSADNSFTSNNEALKIIGKYPKRFMYMASIDIDQSYDKIVEDIKYEKTRGAIGLGELVINRSICDEKIKDLFRACQEEKMPILFHMAPGLGGDYYGIYDKSLLPMLDEALDEFKDLKIIGHSQPFWFEMFNRNENVSPEIRNSYPKAGADIEGRLFDLMRKHDNLYCDLSANSGSNAIINHKMGVSFIKEFEDRILFGTDIYNKDQYFPLKDHLEELLKYKVIGEGTYNKIFTENFEKLFLK